MYVDNANIPFRGHLMCHMLADSIPELHAMADAIGMQRRWFQPKSFPHYDVPRDRRDAAVRLGAIEVDRRGIVRVMRRLRADPVFVAAMKQERERHADAMGHG
ncbi:DUF4031 domain-containing protein [Sphingomonas radiodurans]|uniref:DUF4031 domain-containing protein n=1 Tax=Sphingomonas radiodurans TaxID=2890321 RepID=UPI001E320DFC|nr:DUF4031 domain-containing protein [Sphingomonas radiodurans]WBH18389.1 DUF4031 domain-containing protein [Sphingomonas radiodurans]